MKKILLIFLIFSFPLCAEYKNSKTYHLQIKRGIDKILTGVEHNVHVGVSVISLKSGLHLYEKNAQQLFVPSSITKLFVAGAALTHLGPHYTFETRLLADGPVKHKAIRGNLYLQGSGDPSFILSDLEQLVMELRLMQIEEIQGDIIIDNFAFDAYPDGPGWMWDDINGASFTPMNALSINHNSVQVWVRPADSIATPPKVFAYPKTPFVQIENCATTDEREETLLVERLPRAKKNTIQVKGEIGLRSSLKSFHIPIKGPHLYAATLLQSILKKAGIECKGKIQIQKTPLHAEALATHQSAPLSILLQTMLKNSDNLYADNLFKKIGQIHFQEQGTWKNGSKAIRHHLVDQAGLDASDLVLLDGSGLSRYNLASPQQITHYLSWIYNHSPYRAEFLSALSLAGRDGSLKGRFTTQTLPLRGKTGTMSGISCLSGYVETADGEPLAFSIMINGFTDKASKYKSEVEDQICSFLANLSKKD